MQLRQIKILHCGHCFEDPFIFIPHISQILFILWASVKGCLWYGSKDTGFGGCCVG